MASSHDYRVGDAVVFRISKRSGHPGPRASQVSPEPNGEDYLYEVDKYWIVSECREDGTLVLLTRRGKQHIIHGDNPRLRPAKWWERILHRKRFPQLEEALRLSVAGTSQG
jgi:hypothetical protein